MQDEPKAAFRTGYAHISINVGSKEAVDTLTGRIRWENQCNKNY